MADNYTVSFIFKGVDQVSGTLGGMGGNFKKLGSIVGAGLLAGGTAAFVGLAAGIGVSISEALEAQEVMAQLDQVIAATGGAAGITSQEASDLADALTQVTKFSDETILSAETMLLRFGNISEAVFPQATETALDLATALGTDASSAAQLLGKALEVPGEGLLRLKQAGVVFTDEQEAMIDAMVEAGDTAGAQKLILDALAESVGGSARAAGETAAGQWTIFKNSLLNVAETVGMSILPMLQLLFTQFIQPALPAIQQFGETVATWITGTALPALMEFGNWFATVAWPAIQAFLAPVIAQLIPGLEQLWTWIVQLAGILAELFAPVWDFLAEHMNIVLPVLGVIAAAILLLSSPITAIIAAVVLLATAWANNWGGIQEKVAAVTSFIRDLIGGWLSIIQGFWSVHGETIMAIVSMYWNNIQTVIQTITGIISSIFAAFKAAFEGDWTAFGEHLRDAWDTAWEGIKTILGNAWTVIQSIIANLITSIINFFATTDWGQVGRNIVQGIADGVQAAAQWLINAVINVAQAAIEAVTGFLGIESPSKVFAAIGADVTRGLAAGMENVSPLVSAAGGALGQAAVSGFGSGPGGMGGGVTIGTIAPVIYAAPGMDERELSRVVVDRIIAEIAKRRRAAFYGGIEFGDL